MMETEYVSQPIIEEWEKGGRFYVRLACGHARRSVYRRPFEIAEMKQYECYTEICWRCTEAKAEAAS